jgi:SNF2 family DNA or RNA helicase
VAGRIKLRDRNGLVLVERDGELSETFWLMLRSQWASIGPRPAVRLEVPPEQFLAKRLALRDLCLRFAVSIELDGSVREMLATARSDQRLAQEALTREQDLSDPELQERLSDSGFVRELRSFQTRDLARLLVLPHGANFSVPGAGKTAVELAVYAAERKAGRVEQMLVVAPLSAFGAWMEETALSMERPIATHRYEIGIPIPTEAELVLVNYQWLASAYEAIAHWVASAATAVVLDEAHRMKRGWGGEWGRACLNLAYLASRRDVLTGTPAPNHPRDLQALVDFVWPNQAVRLLPPGAFSPTPPLDIGHRIGERIRPLYTRTTKAELDLPPVSYDPVSVRLEGLQRDIYLALLNQWRGSFRLNDRDRLDLASMGRIVMYLLEAATNPMLLAVGSSEVDPLELAHPPMPIPPESGLRELIENYNKYEVPSKFVVLEELLKRNGAADPPRKTLVWSNFVRNLLTMQKQLQEYQPAMIHGGVPPFGDGSDEVPTRERELDRFRTDPECLVLLANPAALAEGVSLHHACHDAIYLDRTFNAGQYLQSVDRIHRLGLEPGTPTRITFLLTEGTVDETVDQRVRTKAARLGEMLSDPDLLTFALPDEEDYGPAIDGVDVSALLAHFESADD